jgi:hypothetical protein
MPGRLDVGILVRVGAILRHVTHHGTELSQGEAGAACALACSELQRFLHCILSPPCGSFWFCIAALVCGKARAALRANCYMFPHMKMISTMYLNLHCRVFLLSFFHGVMPLSLLCGTLFLLPL